MEEIAIWLLKVVILSAVALLFSFFIMENVFFVINKFSNGSEKQKRRSVLCLIFFAIFLLTMYAYAARSLLFQ